MPMQLNLTDVGANALKLAIDSYYSGLREEIYHTDNYDQRQMLKGIEQALGEIRAQLEPGWQPTFGNSADAGQGVTALATDSLSAEAPPGKGTPPVGMPGTE